MRAIPGSNKRERVKHRERELIWGGGVVCVCLGCAWSLSPYAWTNLLVSLSSKLSRIGNISGAQQQAKGKPLRLTCEKVRSRYDSVSDVCHAYQSDGCTVIAYHEDVKIVKRSHTFTNIDLTSRWEFHWLRGRRNL